MSLRRPLVELLSGGLFLAALTWLFVTGWIWYDRYLLPQARTLPTATPTTTVDPAALREQARRAREVLDHVGAGIALKQAGARDAAVQQFRRALELDPANRDARQNLHELGVEPPAAGTPPRPVPTPARSS